MKPQLLFSTLSLIVSPTLAHTPASELFGSEQTVTIATGRAHPTRTAPAVASVITAQDIRDSGARSVAEALRLVPGFHVGLTTDYGPDLAVRGFSGLASGNLLVLLDGMPQTDLVVGNPLRVLGAVPLDAIERIEVTRGPGSSVFGADAFSGVINVITRRQIAQSQVTLSGGSWKTGDGRLLTGTSDGSADLVLSAERMRSDGPTPIIERDRLSALDEQVGTRFSLAPGAIDTSQDSQGLLLNARLGQTDAMARLSRVHSGLGAGVLGVLDPTGTQQVHTLEGRLDRTLTFSDRVSLTLHLDAAHMQYAVEDVTWFPNNAMFPQGVRFDTGGDQSSWRLRADLRYAVDDAHFITAGLGYEQIRYQIDAIELAGLSPTEVARLQQLSSGLGGPLSSALGAFTQLLSSTLNASDAEGQRRLLAAYVQDEWLIAPKWTLTWGMRLDHYSDVGTQFSPRAVLVWTPLPEWTLKLLYGEGFRAPTQLETQSGLLPTYLANPILEPERLRTLELGLSYQPHPRLMLGLNLFRHETKDQIRLQDRGLYAEPENVGRQVGQGGEFEWRWALTRHLQWRGWYAYQFNTDETTGKDAGYSPHHRLYGSLQYRLDRTFFNLQGMYVGDRARVAEDSRDEAPEYGQLDLLIRQDLNRQVSVQFDIRNLLNAHLYEASPGTALPQDLPLGGRSYLMSVEVRF